MKETAYFIVVVILTIGSMTSFAASLGLMMANIGKPVDDRVENLIRIFILVSAVVATVDIFVIVHYAKNVIAGTI